MKREGDDGDEGAADDRPIFRATNQQRKFDEMLKRSVDDPIRREFSDIVAAANNDAPQDMTAKIAPDSAESLKPVPSATERLELDIDLDDDLYLGIKINDKLFVDGFTKMGVSESKFMMGDQLIGLNARKIKSPSHFQNLLQKHGPHIRVSVYRPMYTTRAHQFRLNKHGITVAVIKAKFPDDQFLIAHVSYRQFIHLGLTINSYNKCVVVARVDKDSLAYLRFEIGDIIIDVEGEQVNDKNEFRNFMMEAMDRNSYASVLIQRPFSPNSVQLAKNALGLAQRDPLDPSLPQDAMIIGRREVQRFKTEEMNNGNNGLRSILNRSPAAQHHLTISNEKPTELLIGSDIPEGRKLMSCPTRAQLHARFRSRMSKKNKKNPMKAEREIINSPIDDTAGQPVPSSPSSSPDGKPKEDSLLRRAQDSWREKRSKMFNNSKKESDSESSLRKTKSKKKVFGIEKEQISDRKSSNSDRSKKEGSDRKKPAFDDGSDKKKKSVGKGGGNEDGSERKLRNDDTSERRRKNDDSGKKKKQKQN